MFCFQCEQTESGTGCTTVGVCGKTPETAGLQDVLLHTLKGHAEVAEAAKAAGVLDENSDRLMLDCVFSTLTNVNFDPVRIKAYLDEVVQSRERLRAQLPADAANKLSSRTSFVPTGEEEQTRAVGVRAKQATLGEDTAGLQELIMYGIKGLAAYAHHAMTLGAESDEVYDFVRSTLSRLDTTTETGDLLGLALETGKANGTVLGLLDSAHRNHFGSPSPAEASLVPKVGPCILVSGHDMGNLRDLLKQAESKGVNVYTHGEMLPAHGYPKLRESPSLAGHYGGPWQLQKFEFAKFPGPILMTTNCIQEPRTSYKARIFTAGPTGWPGVSHIEGNDYSAVIDAALASPGFTAESSAAEASRAKAKTLLTGFGHEAVLGVAETVIGAIDSGALKHIYLVGGCDGAEPERAYFSELAREIKDQPDSLLLTLGCAKYRFNKMDFGTLGGLPRLLDMGQCNDSFSAVQVATTLASHYKCSVNDLPLSISLSWLEQKAVACLLTLLSLNVQNIRLGPALPAFVTPNVLNVLVDKFKLTPIRNDNATGDLKQMFAEKHQA